MNSKQRPPRNRTADLSRRKFLKESSLAATGAAVAANFPFVLTGQAGEIQPIRVGLIGCGGRGTGAAANVLEAADNVKIVAMADLFKDRLESSRNELKATHAEVPDNRCFIGFDAYKHLLALPEVNYVILATMPHFRPLHLRAAIGAGKHVFMEKPVAVDGPGVRSVIESGELAKAKGLSIVAGTQRRHQTDYRETIRRLRDGAIGPVLVGRAYWNGGELWHHGRMPEWSQYRGIPVSSVMALSRPASLLKSRSVFWISQPKARAGACRDNASAASAPSNPGRGSPPDGRRRLA